MPILGTGSSISEERLERMQREMAEGLSSIVGLLDRPGIDFQGPLHELTIRDLAGSLLEVARAADVADTPRRLRVAVVNATYDGGLALLDLVKSHSALPMTPRGPPKNAPPPSGPPGP